jgi:hypothetical protein
VLFNWWLADAGWILKGNKMYKIYCDNEKQFIELCCEFMKKGCPFSANADTLLIELTGAY